jgi:hypothetical protein
MAVAFGCLKGAPDNERGILTGGNALISFIRLLVPAAERAS